MNNKMTKFLNDGDKWLLAEDIPDIDFQFSQIWLSSFVNDMERSIGINYKKILSIYDGYNLKFYYGDKDSEHVSDVILKKITEENFGEEINKKIREKTDALELISTKISAEYLSSLSNEQLRDFYMELDTVHTDFYIWSWLPNAVDMFHSHLTNHFKSILEKYVPSSEEVNKALVALSFWEEKSFVQDEYESLIKLAILKKTNPDNGTEYKERLHKHCDSFFFLKHLWIGKDGVSTLSEYDEAVDTLLASNDNPEALLEEEGQKTEENKKLRQHYEQTLNLSYEEKHLFRTYAEFAFTKTYRRKAQLLWAYKMDFVFEELSKRLGVSFMEARFMLPEEVIAGLVEVLTEQSKKVISERTKHCVYYAEKDLDILVVGDECKKYEETVTTEELGDITEVQGQVACVGLVTGPVKIVNVPGDMRKVNDGDVLISIATNPDILPAMKKAIAFVTEQGGITCHAAIVAREMNKPCVIGTKIATKVFKDGDIVEVDANNGIVRVINGK